MSKYFSRFYIPSPAEVDLLWAFLHLLFPVRKSPSNNLKLFWNFFSSVDLIFLIQKPLLPILQRWKGDLRSVLGELAQWVERREIPGPALWSLQSGKWNWEKQTQGEGNPSTQNLAKTSVIREHERPLSHFQRYASDLLNAYHAGHRSLEGYSPQGQKSRIQLSG